jgi:hypothetical protein
MLPGAWRQPWVRVAYLALPIVTVVLYVAFRHLYPLLFEPLPFEELTSQPAGVRDLPSVLAVWNLVASPPASIRGSGRQGLSDRVRRSCSRSPAPPSRARVAGSRRGAPPSRWRACLSASTRDRARPDLVASAPPDGGAATLPLVASIPVVPPCMALQEIGRVACCVACAGTVGSRRWAGAGGRRVPIVGLAPGEVREVEVLLDAGAQAGAIAGVLFASDAVTPLEGATVELYAPAKVDDSANSGWFFATSDSGNDGRTVRFVERDPAVLAHYRLRPESRLARLLAAPGDTQRAQ